MIEILTSLKTDAKTSDEKVNKNKLLLDTTRHMDAVLDGMIYFADKLITAGEQHDFTKIQYFPEFHKALESGNIKNQEWYKRHISEERHHLSAQPPKDVNLIDVLEYIADCLMAGSARSSKVYDITLSNNLLQLAFDNTIKMLQKEILVKEDIKENE